MAHAKQEHANSMNLQVSMLKSENQSHKEQLDAKTRELKQARDDHEKIKGDYESKKYQKWEQHQAELKQKNDDIAELQHQLSLYSTQIENLEHQHRDEMQRMHASFDLQIQ